MQSGLQTKPKNQQDVDLNAKLHVGIIMDGNGRWAVRQGLTRHQGHIAGVEALRRVVEAAPKQGIGTLTLYAFSSDNWRRPPAEVMGLMELLRFYLDDELDNLVRNDVRLTVIGRRDRIPAGLAREIGRAERASANGNALRLRVAIDYSARDAILCAASRAQDLHELNRDNFSALITGEAGLARRRSRHPHLWRAAAVRFPVVGERLRRTLLHRSAVARLRCRRSRAGAGELPQARAALWWAQGRDAGSGDESLALRSRAEFFSAHSRESGNPVWERMATGVGKEALIVD